MKYRIQSKDGHKIVDLNRRKAIRERCLNCSAWVNKEVANCSFQYCVLYPFRSGQGKQIPKDRNSAIKKYCLWCMNDQRSEIKKCTCPDCPLFPYRNGGIDRSQNTPVLSKKGDIGLNFEDKTKTQYQSMA
ncbi:MAG: hypothetical protein K9L30_11695 [Desulfobacterales bacterium]|nr:hypothetical protein [Desulfobacterales bacterium]